MSEPASKPSGAAVTRQAPPPRPVAVIDVGTTAVRMTVAQIRETGSPEALEFFQQAVSLGKDTFTKGFIEKTTIEECVRALKGFRRALEEYGITAEDQIRAVATTAVREASNRDAFLDRVCMATGIQVDPIDEADVTRLTYLSVHASLKDDPLFRKSTLLVTEVGGGGTELLLLHQGNVEYSRTFGLGSLRLREVLESFRSPVAQNRALLETEIQRRVDEILQDVSFRRPLKMLALGGDVRFAAARLRPGWDQGQPGKITVAGLARLADEIAGLSVDDLVTGHHLSIPDAETVGPALLIYLRLARSLGLREIRVANISMRSGMLLEMGAKDGWKERLGDQILRAALELCRKYHADEAHARHVTELARSLFFDLHGEHRLGARHEILLTAAALLHDVGLFVSDRNHHKHSQYLIQHSELFGLSRKDMLLVSLIARYHRRGSPKPTHTDYLTLSREDRLAVAKLAAILRVADALDRSHSQRIQKIRCVRGDEHFIVSTPYVGDLALEQLALKEKGSMFEEVYGMAVTLRPEEEPFV